MGNEWNEVGERSKRDDVAAFAVAKTERTDETKKKTAHWPTKDDWVTASTGWK